ncbi:MAG: hypothetical protein AAF610_01180 [Pseudomonadota bacterium]
MSTPDRRSSVLHRIGLVAAVLLSSMPVAADVATEFVVTRPASVPDDQTLVAEGAVVGRIQTDRRGIFDHRDNLNWLLSTANRLHRTTRESVVRSQLVFATGEPYDPRKLQESERILRSNQFLFDAAIVPVSYRDGVVDIEVVTRDLWSIEPTLSLKRSGGENQTTLGIEDENFLGTGALLGGLYERDLDRRTRLVYFADRQLGTRWLSLAASAADSNDGHRYAFSLGRPFFALETRYAWNVQAVDFKRVDSLYRLGDELVDYEHDERFLDVWGGWSRGLQNGWVRRWRVGIVANDNRFAPPPNGIRAGVVPADRELIYPYVSVTWLEDRFIKTANVQQIARTEDFFLGAQLGLTLGYAGTSLGSDRSAWIIGASAQRGFGRADHKLLLLDAQTRGRIESGRTANGTLSFRARYFHRQSAKWLQSITLSGVRGQRLDLDRPLQLGGDIGLRGYPVRYQSGESRVLFSFEQRYFTDWYPWRVLRVGAAAFVDAGRTFGDNPIGGQSLGWLRSVGVGLRLAPTRGGRKVFHLDVAFPLDGDPSIDSVQISFQGKRGF